MQGTTTSVRNVVTSRPKMIVHASGPQNTELSPPMKKLGLSRVKSPTKSMFRPMASGTRPRIAAEAVSSTGVRRVVPPSMMAVGKSSPRCRNSSMNSMRMMPFLTTMPPKAMKPTPVMTMEMVMPVSEKPNNTPIKLKMTVVKMMSGLVTELNCATMTMNMRARAAKPAPIRNDTVSCWSSCSPAVFTL